MIVYRLGLLDVVRVVATVAFLTDDVQTNS